MGDSHASHGSLFLGPDLFARVKAEADARGLAPTWLARKLMGEALDDLRPAEEWRLTRPRLGALSHHGGYGPDEGKQKRAPEAVPGTARTIPLAADGRPCAHCIAEGDGGRCWVHAR